MEPFIDVSELFPIGKVLVVLAAYVGINKLVAAQEAWKKRSR